jgi:hypothetical protein
MGGRIVLILDLQIFCVVLGYPGKKEKYKKDLGRPPIMKLPYLYNTTLRNIMDGEGITLLL